MACFVPSRVAPDKPFASKEEFSVSRIARRCAFTAWAKNSLQIRGASV
jgi:hypothetical protein